MAILFPERLVSTAEIQAPILHPRIIKNTWCISTTPCPQRAIRIPTVADELCRMDVTANPKNTHKNGFDNCPSVEVTNGASLTIPTAEDMVPIPINRIPKPTITSPNFLTIGCCINITMITPTKRITGAYLDISRDRSWPVTVVPILAPKITPIA